jgi:hypothetical protein
VGGFLRSNGPCSYGAAAAALGWLAEALDLRIYWQSNAQVWGGVSWRKKMDAEAEALFSTSVARRKQREADHLATHRFTCAAKTRKCGECRNKSEPGKHRCKFHGGKSSGSKTPEGIARIILQARRH